jgi:hypothetical protein
MPTTWILPLLIGVVLMIAAVACTVMAPRLATVIRLAAAIVFLPLALFCVYGFVAAAEPGNYHIVWRIGYPVLFVACLAAVGRLVFTKSARPSSPDSAEV